MRVILISATTMTSTFKKAPIGTSTPIFLEVLEERLFARAQIGTCRKQNQRKQYQSEWHSNCT